MLDEYKSYLLQKGKYSQNTIKSYINNIKKFIEWLKSQNPDFDEKTIEQANIFGYINYLMCVKEYRITGIKLRMASLTSYCQFLYDCNIITAMLNIKYDNSPKGQEGTVITIPSRSEIEKFRLEVYGSDKSRDIALVELILNTGIKIGELVGLKLNDLRKEGESYILHINNRNKSRVIPLNSIACNAMNKYLSEYNPKNNLWSGQRGSISKDGINKMIQRYARSANTLNIHPNSLRDFFASNLTRRKSVDAFFLADFLGLSNVNITKKYYEQNYSNVQNLLEDINT